MPIAIIQNIGSDNNAPGFEIIENGNDIHLRIAVPGLTNKEIRVQTVGTQLFVQTALDRNLQNGARRLDGSYLSPQFEMEFVIANDITVGAPFVERGVLTIPLTSNPEIKMEVRDYSVRELSKVDAAPVGTDDWVYKNSHS
jgi:HSP20 family molecular chaperone IbpA